MLQVRISNVSVNGKGEESMHISYDLKVNGKGMKNSLIFVKDAGKHIDNTDRRIALEMIRELAIRDVQRAPEFKKHLFDNWKPDNVIVTGETPRIEVA